MRKSVKVMAAAMAAMMALAGCGSKTAETTAADTKAAETTAVLFLIILVASNRKERKVKAHA